MCSFIPKTRCHKCRKKFWGSVHLDGWLQNVHQSCFLLTESSFHRHRPATRCCARTCGKVWVMVADKWQDSGPQDLVTVSVYSHCHQSSTITPPPPRGDLFTTLTLANCYHPHDTVHADCHLPGTVKNSMQNFGAEILWFCKPTVVSAVPVGGLRGSCSWRIQMWRSGMMLLHVFFGRKASWMHCCILRNYIGDSLK